MDKPIDHFWQIRLEALKEALESNNFQAHVAADADEAKRLVLEELLPATGAETVSWGGSLTMAQVGLLDALRSSDTLQIIDTSDKSVSREETLERRRRALLADCFFTGTNAVTETGHLVNLDMYGNRVAGLTFGPRHVIVLCGRNKVTPDLEEAMLRIKDFAAPVNAMRLNKKTPCAKTAVCQDCSSEDRICNTWTITEKSCPKGRTTVVLINQDLGF
jgi:L-lactate utilization protein LutB